MAAFDRSSPLSSFPRRRESSSGAAMKRDFSPTVYIMASARNGTLYIGVTSKLLQRIAQHREEITGGFTAKYDVKLLVWFEQHATMEHAITREKQLKKWNRAWKLRMIERENPEWRDLAEEFGFETLR
jgi:putative endonuclease